MDAHPLWCLGFPLVEQRSFTIEEAARLRLQRRNAYLFAVLVGLLGSVSSFSGMLAGLMVFRDNLGLCALSFIAGMPLTACCFFLGYRCLLHGNMAGRELKQGTLQCFAGTVHVTHLMQLKKIGNALKFPVNNGDPCEVWVYSATGRLLHISGHYYRGWEIAPPRYATAALPPSAAIAAEWLEEVGTTDTGDPVFAGTRELSVEELEEIRLAANHAWWHPLQRLLGIAILPELLLIAAIVTRHPYQVHLWLLFIIYGLGAITILRGLAIAARLTRGRRLGRVGMLRIEPTSPEGAESTAEILIGANLFWSQDGRPAVWRGIPTV